MLNGLALSIIGVMVGGSYNLIVSTIAADLGKMPRLSSNKEALGTVTGLIDGTGSVGSAVGQLIIPPINANFGWTWVFFVFVVMVRKMPLSKTVTKLSLKELRLDPLPTSSTHQRREDFAQSPTPFNECAGRRRETAVDAMICSFIHRTVQVRCSLANPLRISSFSKLVKVLLSVYEFETMFSHCIL